MAYTWDCWNKIHLAGSKPHANKFRVNSLTLEDIDVGLWCANNHPDKHKNAIHSLRYYQELEDRITNS